MIHSTKRDKYWSFWCQEWFNHQDQDIFWWNEAVEVIEAIEVVEAVEVIEAAEVLRIGKITTGDFRVIQVLEFSFILIFWEIFLGGRNMIYQVEF